MKLKKMWKRFWTLDVHNHAGFTLVELIIVIAILAILSTGAIAGYSAYVEKANITADKALIAEIENVLLLAYYNGDISANGHVVLNTNDDPATATNNLTDILQEAYGANWNAALKLKYQGWESTYQGSSFAGNETALLDKVDTLTGLLGDLLKDNPDMVGSGFSNFLTQNGIENTDENLGKISDAAVMYVAQSTSNLTDKDAAVNAMATLNTCRNHNEALNHLLPAFGNSTVNAAAALYAVAEAYCRFELTQYNNAEPLTALNSSTEDIKSGTVTSATQAFESVFASFGAALSKQSDGAISRYFGNEGWAKKDAEAYISLLGTANSAQSTIMGDSKFGDEDYFSSGAISNLFASVANGGVIIYVEIEDGIANISNTAKEQ